MTREEQVNKTRELLVGSCMADLHEVCEELGLKDEGDALQLVIEAEIDRCAVCDWWHDHSDMDDDGDWVCCDCAEENA